MNLDEPDAADQSPDDDRIGASDGKDRPAGLTGSARAEWDVAVMVGSPVLDHVEAAFQELSETITAHGRAGVRRWREAGVRSVHAAVSAAREGLLPLDVETMGRLLFALTDVPVRDAACAIQTSGEDDAVEQLWLDLTLHAPASFGAAPAAVLGYLRWVRGDFEAARKAAEIAVNLDPQESLAPLVVQAASNRIEPMGAAAVADRVSSRGQASADAAEFRRARRRRGRTQRRAG